VSRCAGRLCWRGSGARRFCRRRFSILNGRRRRAASHGLRRFRARAFDEFRFGDDSERERPRFNRPPRGLGSVCEVVAEPRRESGEQHVAGHCGAARRRQIRRDPFLQRADDDVDFAPVRARQIAQQSLDAFRRFANAATVFKDNSPERLAWQIVHGG
jgi:hypothetical protein